MSLGRNFMNTGSRFWTSLSYIPSDALSPEKDSNSHLGLTNRDRPAQEEDPNRIAHAAPLLAMPGFDGHFRVCRNLCYLHRSRQQTARGKGGALKDATTRTHNFNSIFKQPKNKSYNVTM